MIGIEWSAAMTLAAASGVAAEIASHLFAVIELNMMLAFQESKNGG